MNINDLESFKLSDVVKFHPTLNPLIFTDDRMQDDVRQQLLLIAEDFVDFMGIDSIKVVDVRLYGSNAAYTYTKHSDIDLHILVDMSDISDDEVYSELFNSKKRLYNDSHNITVRGSPVELYMQSSTEKVKSLGDYSVLKDRWVSFPKRSKSSFEESVVVEKFKRLVVLSELALRSDDIELLDKLLDTIRRYRKAGLEEGGEFSPENLAYKVLRSKGIVDKLYKHRDVLHGDELSIDEDYDANGQPPGPEFPPTMPAGTVRVDVSDVYDWYKLGQHISNLDGLGKHDFGSGPPSTIMAFGSEDQEHKYIDALKKTGLTTTDIDPFDPKQPKSMKRQKVDPTYNVNEAIEKRLESELNQFMEANQPRDTKRQKTDFAYNVNEIIDMPPVTKRMDIQSMYNDIQTKLRYHEATQLTPINFPMTNRIFRDGQNVLTFFLFNKENKPVYYLSTSKFHDGFKTGAVAGDAEVQGQGLGWKLYKAVGDYLGKPLYSDSTQTADSKNGIWGKLINNFPKQVVGYDQTSRKNVPIKDIYQTLPRDQLKDVGDAVRRNTPLLKLLPSVITEASGYIPTYAERNDPRFSMALSVDVDPDIMPRQAKSMGLGKIKRDGRPQELKSNGKFTR